MKLKIEDGLKKKFKIQHHEILITLLNHIYKEKKLKAFTFKCQYLHKIAAFEFVKQI